jgi:hypothetical protein
VQGVEVWEPLIYTILGSQETHLKAGDVVVLGFGAV